MISTYPPTRCGLADFAGRLRAGLLTEHADAVRIVRVGEPPRHSDPPEVVAWLMDSRVDAGQAATALNECDVAVIQHEFGVYDGGAGENSENREHREYGEHAEDILRVADLLRVPSIAVLHIVPACPSPYERAVLEGLSKRVHAIAVFSDAAAKRLHADYAVDAAKIAVIPHGADAPHAAGPGIAYADGHGDRQAVILTWGLLRPGKGIEWGIEALAAVRAAGIDAKYVVAGPTHPKIRAADGEEYRTRLADLAHALGVDSAVEFDETYHSPAGLARLIGGADVVLVPYDSTDQVASRVLTRALVGARPVVATAFPHARELLGDGVGVVVPHRDPRAIGRALRRILTEPGTAAAMTARAAAMTARFDWSAVSAGYGCLTSLLRAEQAQLVA